MRHTCFNVHENTSIGDTCNFSEIRQAIEDLLTRAEDGNLPAQDDCFGKSKKYVFNLKALVIVGRLL